MMPRRSSLVLCAAVLAVVAAVACGNPDLESRTFFEQRIAPILDENCVRGPADNLCHAKSQQKPGEALGNLDLSSYEALKKRPELLAPYGSYPEPVLLLKAVKPSEVTLSYAGQSHGSEIFHGGGGILSRSGAAFVELQSWLRDGATEDGFPAETEPPRPVGPCSHTLRPEVQPFVGQAQGPAYDEFKTDIQPILEGQGCGAGSCHGSTQSDFYLTCGTNEDELRHNFVVARSFVSLEVDRSELLLRPLAPAAGGVHHSGGDIWSSVKDGEFSTFRSWAARVGPLGLDEGSPELDYFVERVMPVLLKRGCAMPQCHSPPGFNDYRLRAGSRGFFSPLALRRNYETTLREFVSLDAKSVNESRILKKNISVTHGGIEHRAGITLLSDRDKGGDPTLCPAGDDDQPSSYCTVVEWIRRERAAATAADRVSPLDPGDTVPIVYVDRPPNPDRVIDFDVYRGGARLMRVDVAVGLDGAIDLVSPHSTSEIDLSSCVAATDYDVRRPDIRWDGSRMVFGLRAGENDGLNLYESNLDGTDCLKLTDDGGRLDNGVRVHHFDPLYVPPDDQQNPAGAIVFASTQPGKLGRSHVSPRYRLPATNLWRIALDGSGAEQMTFLTGSELSPALMQNGQITMTTEKATDGFYQLAGRRINWDRTDYHPLLAQREMVGFRQATDIRESLDRNFLLVASDPGSWFSGGSLVSFNRSIGPFDIARRGEPGYLESVTHLDPAARESGKSTASGAYRTPFPAPDGTILVSYAAGEFDLRDKAAAVDFDLVIFDPVSLTKTTVVPGGDGRFQVDGVIGYKRSLRHVFVNVPQLVFGGSIVAENEAVERAWAHFPDFPMLATLLTKNNRGHRGLEAFDDGNAIAIYSADPPPIGDADDGDTHQRWTLLGSHALAADGSVFLDVPAGIPVILELRAGTQPLLTMTEEHQFGPGELTSLGVARRFFDGVCGGCHGSTAGPELDVVVNPDALTGASVSLSRPDGDSRPPPL